MRMYSLDFETEAIVFGSKTPPKPVGCAIRNPDGKKKYFAFGHPTENNCTWDEFYSVLAAIWHHEMVGHNILGFDLEVAMYWFKLPPRDPLLTEDTLFQAYLIDPHAPSLKLKDLARDWLGMATDAQEELQLWILNNVPECKTINQTGAYICRAPGDLVGKYAIADADMAWELHQYCKPKLAEMAAPYDRERVLAPILASIQQGGIRVDLERLRRDYAVAIDKLHQLDDLIRKHLSAPDLNPGSDKELVRALKDANYTGFLKTPGGKDSVAKGSLEAVLAADPKLQSMIRSRATYSTLTGTFMRPWIILAEANGGTINPSYNQVRNPDGYGTRTGRLSSSNPNGQNIPGDQGTDYYGDPFPQMRSYCLPDEGCVWYSFDFKSQEPRLTAHFEDGTLMQAFVEDPNLDPYIFVMNLVGGDVTRKDSKVIFLGLVYSMGAAALAGKLDCSTERATSLRNAIRAVIPEVNQLDRDCKRRFELGLPIKTLGGRLCFCEPPSNGRVWAYKALNLLIQGSAADQTKEAMIYAEEELRRREVYTDVIEPYNIPFRMLGSVHDEINLCAPLWAKDHIEQVMHEAANALPCDVPMRLTMGIGNTWAEAAKG
jgi:DNA polymerase I-like protein with 3'-5' exonuclease and polymerase domains